MLRSRATGGGGGLLYSIVFGVEIGPALVSLLSIPDLSGDD